MHKWLLPTLSEVLAQSELARAESLVSQIQKRAETENSYRRAMGRMAKERVKAEREWCAAMTATEQLMLQTLDPLSAAGGDAQKSPWHPVSGLVLAGPVPVFSHPAVIDHVKTGIFTAGQFNPLAFVPFQLPPATDQQVSLTPNESSQLNLLPGDPLAEEQFCLVFTASFSLVMVLGEQLDGTPAFQFSFEPEVIEQAWNSLRARVALSGPHQLGQLDALVEQFSPSIPDYRTVMQFSRQLLKHISEQEATRESCPTAFAEKSDSVQHSLFVKHSAGIHRDSCAAHLTNGTAIVSEDDSLTLDGLETRKRGSKKCGLGTKELDVISVSSPISNPPDVELLQAFAHEVRTPLTTIRTLIRLLLKRRDLAPDIVKRLEIIDHECTEQIDRMELIFRAVELETAPVKQTPVHLTPISLGQVFQHSIPRWQKQASRRNLTLDVVLPQKLPAVVSNPVMLDQVLTGLIENFTRNVPSGGHIQVEVTPAGDQLKLQLQSLPLAEETGPWKEGEKNPPIRKSIGQLLMFQPETGNISLNLNVTKNLFQALGGKLIVRQRRQQGEVMTIFLPLS